MTEPQRPEIVIIAAVAEKNRVIGRDQDLPWHIPEDLKRFKRLTTGHPLVMGRKTFESVVHQFGGPLPNRRNIVVSASGKVMNHSQVEVAATLDEAIEAASSNEVIFIGGGAAIYEQMLGRADRLELTLVEGNYDGDTYFPPYEHLIGDVFVETASESHDDFRFVTYERASPDGRSVSATHP
jgi:dihydrofolate reductase